MRKTQETWLGGVRALALLGLGLAGCTPGGEPAVTVGTVAQAVILPCTCFPQEMCPVAVDDTCAAPPTRIVPIRPGAQECTEQDVNECTLFTKSVAGPRWDEKWVACFVRHQTKASPEACGVRLERSCSGGVCDCRGCVQWVSDIPGQAEPTPVCRDLRWAEEHGLCGAAGGICQPFDAACASCDSGVLTPKAGKCSDAAGASGICLDGRCCTGCTDASGACVQASPSQPAASCGVVGTSGELPQCVACDKAAGVVCQVDVCREGRCEVVPAADSTPCDEDGDWCTVDNCYAGSCVASGKRCTGQGECFSERCLSAEQRCETDYYPERPCDEGRDPCMLAECNAEGTCVELGPRICADDGNECTAQACDPALDRCVVTHLANEPCSTGCGSGFCDDRGVCQLSGGGSCPAPAECERFVGCQLDDLGSPDCQYAPLEAGAACTKSDPCAREAVCDGHGTCVDSPERIRCGDCQECVAGECVAGSLAGTDCDDANPCTREDRCREAGVCEGTTVTCALRNDCDLTGICELASGACAYVQKPTGAECVDSLARTGLCWNGVCVHIPEGTGGSGGEGGSATGGDGGVPVGGSSGGTGGATGGGGATSGGSGGASQAGASAVGGSAGVPGAVGGAIGGGAAPAGSGGGPSAGTAGQDPGDELFERDPGGCSCRAAGSERGGTPGLLGLLAAVGLGMMRRRRAS